VITSALLKDFEHGFGLRTSGLTQDKMVSLKQIHSGIVWTADRDTGCMGEGDALIATRPGAAVSIRTADCLPILIADRRTRAVAAVHAGWRGTVARIAAGAVAKMHAEFGSRSEDLTAVIGPGIGACCYEVGVEVARQFGKSEAGKIDLAAENRKQLEQAGVPRVDVIEACTFCDPERFWSYRREGEQAGRMISFIRVPQL
jgi:YfiH family protein